MYNILLCPRSGKSNKDGSLSIVLRVSIKDQGRKSYGTGLTVSPGDCWDKKYQEPTREAKRYKALLRDLDKVKAKANEILERLDLEDKLNHNAFADAFKSDKSRSFLKFYRKELEIIAPTISEATAQIYRRPLTNLEGYVKMKGWKDLYFSQVDFDFIGKFKSYLILFKQLGEGTLERRLSHLRIFVTRAVNKDKIRKNPFITFKLKKPKSKAKYITEREVIKLIQTRMKHDGEERARLYLLFGIGGAPFRFSDMMTLKKDQVRAGMIFLEGTIKTDEQVRIPLSKLSLEVLDRLEMYNSASEYLFPPISNYQLNQHCKTIAGQLDFTRSLSSTYTVRHTFGTLAKEKGMQKDAIMALPWSFRWFYNCYLFSGDFAVSDR